MTTNIDTNGYTFPFGGYTFFVFHNHQLTQEILTQLQNYVSEWLPIPTEGFMTICADDGYGQVGIYQIDRVMNLFAICPKYMDNTGHIREHMNGILFYIHELIKHWVTLHQANEIRFKIAFYKPLEVSEVPYKEWPGNWRFTRTTRINICDTSLFGELSEYAVRWSFEDNYQIKTGILADSTISGWGTSNPNNSLNRWGWNKKAF